MKELEKIIREKGKVLPGDILKIDNFLNHQVDIKIIDLIAEEFAEEFKDAKPDKLLTIEASGISICMAVARKMGMIPFVFAKKTNALNMSENTYVSYEHSYTRDVNYMVQVAKEYLKQGERVLILDDFLANGEAMNSLIDICNQAKVKIVGCGSVVSKTYQPGEERIKKLGYPLKVLARVKSMSEDGYIEFEE